MMTTTTGERVNAAATMTRTTMKRTKWKVGDVARYVTRTCSRYLILEVCADKNNWGEQQYCCLSDSGTVCYHNDQDLLTLPEWMRWWERFQDETTGKEYRERQEAARLEFVPPPWWAEAVERATEPYR